MVKEGSVQDAVCVPDHITARERSHLTELELKKAESILGVLKQSLLTAQKINVPRLDPEWP